nr:MAG TPA: hypothetical protein [Caudoviricetes sp.]
MALLCDFKVKQNPRSLEFTSQLRGFIFTQKIGAE